jgi:hypothetical protein
MRLAASLRYSVYGLAGVLVASGALWLVFHYLVIASQDHAGWAAAAMRVHGAAAMALLVLAGSAISLHATNAWRERKNRSSGIALGLVLIVLTITGYLLYYAGGEAARSLASLSHWIAGLALPGVFAAHALLGRRSSGC